MVLLEADENSKECYDWRGELGGCGDEVASGSVEWHTTAPVSWAANVQLDP